MTICMQVHFSIQTNLKLLTSGQQIEFQP